MPRWQSKLSRPIPIIKGPTLNTLADARAYMVRLPTGDAQRNSWQHAAGLLLAAAERKGDITAATHAIETALFLQARWLPPR